MTGPRTMAAAQTVPQRGDVDANLERHQRLARAAAEHGVQILVFPELSLTGYELELAGDLAFSERDPRLDPLVELASATDMALVVGAPARIETRLHIGAFIVYPDRPVELYTKRHLGAFPPDVDPDGVVPPAEATVFHPGNRNPLVTFHGHAAAVGVCADTGRPSHPEEAARRGAKSYLASMFFTPPELEQEAARLRGYAVRHSMAVVMANFGGPTGGLTSAGRSAIWSEEGELLAQLGRKGPGLVIAARGESGWRAKTVVLRGPES